MSEPLNFAQVAENLRKADDILLLCHKNPDGDTTGSASALCHALKSIGKNCAVLCPDAIPEKYHYLQLPLFEKNFTPQYIVSVDVASTQLLGSLVDSAAKQIHLCIDHHPSNSGFADMMLLKTDAAATAEIVYDLLVAMDIPLTNHIADCLYTGLATDTGCFKFSNTTAHTHIVCAKLMEAGADIKRLNHLLFESKTKSQLALERIALENLSFHFEQQCALICITQEQLLQANAQLSDIDSITGIPRAIEGVKAGITIRQMPNGYYKISVRTVCGIDASQICKGLGGGGHKQAAGCEILGSMESAKQAILSEVQKALCTES